MSVSTQIPRTTHWWKGHDGVRLAGDTLGDPNGTPIILLHGAGQTRHSWRRMAHLLGDAGFYVISFDARGHGNSDWPADSNYSPSAMVRDLEHIALSLGVKRPVLVGAATGGATSLLAVGEHYVDASGLILINFAPQTEPGGVARVQSNMRQQSAALGRAESCDPHFASWPRDMTRRHQRLSAAARRLTCPTLLIRGERSDVISQEGVEEFRVLCPQTEYIGIQDVGHQPSEYDQDFGEKALHFIKSRIGNNRPRTRRLYEQT
ncbi:Alpha/beta hydrolase [Paraburkholderia piptadeniae]|uniref:Alpha/beta hydrolase n=1 Tax=Paraburkholderia piptadeniae TaxID=1701573 RepID=A0A1N7S2Y6_9BURK|nr:alpha/beta hydrolase [Paraburkholderia piptadeniae]SIT41737.1 Alpha/beta hydrolase [Paraburkholderia piptadeniae]